MAQCDVSVGAIHEVVVRGRWNEASDIVNVYQLRYVSGSTLTPSAFYSDVGNWVAALYDLVKIICNVVTVFESYSVAHLNGNCASGELAIPGGSLAGEGTADAVPPGVAALFSFATGIKRVKMRKYFGGLDSTMLNEEGTLAPPTGTPLGDIRNFLIAPYTTGSQTYQYGYFSPKTAEWQVPLTGVAHTLPAYQRRRRPGTGA